MEKKDFLNNRDRILNDIFDRYTGTELARVLDALIVFEAISNDDKLKVFRDKAINAQYELILLGLRSGRYRIEVVLS